eukprot:SAG11_NODE_1260_length_5357_cov_3.137505_2_plen_283_part_00
MQQVSRRFAGFPAGLRHTTLVPMLVSLPLLGNRIASRAPAKFFQTSAAGGRAAIPLSDASVAQSAGVRIALVGHQLVTSPPQQIGLHDSLHLQPLSTSRTQELVSIGDWICGTQQRRETEVCATGECSPARRADVEPLNASPRKLALITRRRLPDFLEPFFAEQAMSLHRSGAAREILDNSGARFTTSTCCGSGERELIVKDVVHYPSTQNRELMEAPSIGAHSTPEILLSNGPGLADSINVMLFRRRQCGYEPHHVEFEGQNEAHIPATLAKTKKQTRFPC